MDGKTGFRRVRGQNLLGATKNKKLWRVMISQRSEGTQNTEVVVRKDNKKDEEQERCIRK